MENREAISFGYKRSKKSPKPSKERSKDYFTQAAVIAAAGAIFCASFLGGYVKKGGTDADNASFEAVYAMAHTDGGNSVLTGSMEDGEWSFWAYLEYMITKLIGSSQ